MNDTLTPLFRPCAVAIFGASDDPGRIGGRPLAYYLRGGFAGPVYPINPRRASVQGLTAYPDLASVPGPVDFALIILPAERVLAALEDCAAHGVKAVVLFSAGFAETGPAGAALQAELVARARAAGIRLLGPNCLGLFHADHGHFPTFSSFLEQHEATPGPVAVVSQSGAYGSYLLTLLARRGVRVGIWASTGNEADISAAELTAHLLEESSVRVLAVYLEAFREPGRWRALLTRARRLGKPVLVIKVGASPAGAAAAVSHTASLAGSDTVLEAVLCQWGALRVGTTEQLVDLVYACTRGCYPTDEGLAMVTVSGGAGVLMADAAEAAGLAVPALPETTQSALRALVPHAGTRNPVDLTAQPMNDLNLAREALRLLLDGPPVAALLGFFLTWSASPRLGEALCGMLAEVAREHPARLLVMVLVAPEARVRTLEAAGIRVFEDPDRAVRAVAGLVRLGRGFTAPLPAPPPTLDTLPVLPAGPPDEVAARAVLTGLDIPLARGEVARSEAEALAIATRLGGELVLKVVSRDLPHKSEAGGVRPGVAAADTATVYREMLTTVAARAPHARVAEVLVCETAPPGLELIVSAHRDRVAGPVVMLGLGGVLAEALQQVVFRGAPFGEDEARRMIGELPGQRLLAGFRGAPAADVVALAGVLARLSVFAAGAEDGFRSLEINPLRVLGQGVVALDGLLVADGGDTRD